MAGRGDRFQGRTHKLDRLASVKQVLSLFNDYRRESSSASSSSSSLSSHPPLLLNVHACITSGILNLLQPCSIHSLIGDVVRRLRPSYLMSDGVDVNVASTVGVHRPEPGAGALRGVLALRREVDGT